MYISFNFKFNWRINIWSIPYNYAEILYSTVGRTDPNLDDVGLAFRNMGVSISELEEYIRHVEPLPFAHEIVQFPAPKKCNLQIPNPSHKELQTREEHIEDYMPLLYPTPEGKGRRRLSSVPPLSDNLNLNCLQILYIHVLRLFLGLKDLLILINWG